MTALNRLRTLYHRRHKGKKNITVYDNFHKADVVPALRNLLGALG